MPDWTAVAVFQGLAALVVAIAAVLFVSGWKSLRRDRAAAANAMVTTGRILAADRQTYRWTDPDLQVPSRMSLRWLVRFSYRVAGTEHVASDHLYWQAVPIGSDIPVHVDRRQPGFGKLAAPRPGHGREMMVVGTLLALGGLAFEAVAYLAERDLLVTY